MKKTQEVPRMPASAFAIEIGELIPSGIFLLLALVLPFVFYHVGGGSTILTALSTFWFSVVIVPLYFCTMRRMTFSS